MNILLLSVGTRDLVVRSFKKALEGCGQVICADMSPLAPALYETERRYLVPRMTEPGYLDRILEICRNEQVDGVLSLIDPELSLLAANEEKFREIGTRVVGSSLELCELALNKYNMYLWLREHDVRHAASWISLDAFLAALDAGTQRFPVFVKPVRGSASISIFKVSDRKTLELLMEQGDCLMIQEFLDGREIGADIYVDLISGETVSIFTKKKIRMRAGETDKSVSFRDPRLFAFLERFVAEAGFRGPIDVDIFEVNGEYYVSEVNPRFGGGYPHAYACGCDFPAMIRNNLEGRVNERRIGEYEDDVYMMKYNEIRIERDLF